MNTTTYSTLLVLNDGGQTFEDTTREGLLAQTQAFLADYRRHHPPGYRPGRYNETDDLFNRFTAWSIARDRPAYDDGAIRHYYVTIH